MLKTIKRSIILLFISFVMLFADSEITLNMSAYLKDYYNTNKIKDILNIIWQTSNDKCSYNTNNELICKASEEDIKQIIDNDSIKGVSIFSQYSKTEFAAIGVGINKNKATKAFVIDRIYKGSPAQKANLQTNDEILNIDGESVKNLTTDEVINKLRGKNGTTIMLTLKRNEDTITKAVIRSIIKIQKDEMLIFDKNNTLQIALNENFYYKFSSDFKDILFAKPYKKLVIDLRNSNGGNFNEILKSLGLFLPQNTELFYILDKNGMQENFNSIDAKDGLKFKGEVEILVDETTKAGSLLFAYAMAKHYKSCKIIGNKSGEFSYLYTPKELPHSQDKMLYIMKVATGQIYSVDKTLLSGKTLFEVISLY